VKKKVVLSSVEYNLRSSSLYISPQNPFISYFLRRSILFSNLFSELHINLRVYVTYKHRSDLLWWSQ